MSEDTMQARLEGAKSMAAYIWALATPEGMGTISLTSDFLPETDEQFVRWDALWQDGLPSDDKLAIKVGDELYKMFLARFK